MRISQKTVGWALVALCAGVLVLLMIGRWQQPSFAGTLPYSQLSKLALAQAQHFGLIGEPAQVETAIMTIEEWSALHHPNSPITPWDGVVYLYRVYGDIPQLLVDPDGILEGREYLAIEVALDARSGEPIGIMGHEKKTTPHDLKLPLQTQTALPEITAETLP